MSPPRRALGIAAVVGVAAVLAAGGLKLWWDHAIEQVSVVLTDARVGVKIGMLGMPSSAVVDTVFEVENGNFLGAELASIDYVVRINGRVVGPGHGPPAGTNRSIVASGKSSVTTSTDLGLLALAQAGIDGVVEGRADVDVEGDIHATILGLPMQRHFKARRPATVTRLASELNGKPDVGVPR